MANNPTVPAAPNPGPSGEFILYQTEDGRTKLQVRVEDQTVWLTQRLIAELFQVTPQNVTQHLRTIYSEGELDAAATCKKFLQVQSEGDRQVTRLADHYNLDAILAVGYRVRSPRGTQFRQWATAQLRELLVKGFALNRIVSAYLEFAELQAIQRRPMHMADWIAKLDDFLRLSDRDILTHAGKISHEAAVEKAEAEFGKFHAAQDALPQPVDRQFEQTLDELKQIEKQKAPDCKVKKPTKKKPKSPPDGQS